MLTAIPEIPAHEAELSRRYLQYLRKLDEIIQDFRTRHPGIEAIAKAIESMSIEDSLKEAIRISRMKDKDVEPWLKKFIGFMVTAMACIDSESGERAFR